MTYDAEVNLLLWMMDVFRTGTDSGVGMASPVGWAKSGGIRDLFPADFCLAIW